MKSSQHYGAQRQKKEYKKYLLFLCMLITCIILFVAVMRSPNVYSAVGAIALVLGIASTFFGIYEFWIKRLGHTSPVGDHTIQSPSTTAQSETELRASRTPHELPVFWNVPLQRSELFTGREDAFLHEPRP